MPKRSLKIALHAVSFALAVLPAAASGFGRWRTAYELFAQCFALAPGIPGDYLRVAFYKLTLNECSLSCRISFGSFFAHSGARVGPNVYIGAYCVIGHAVIGARTQIASGVQILSGGRQHSRNEAGGISGADGGVFTTVAIGSDCWIGAGTIVMADVGAGTTIGAGSVVSRSIPPASVAVGSPARVIRTGAAGEI
jgi:acetyltransferase-like isoleucine patch superfamily enzyme